MATDDPVSRLGEGSEIGSDGRPSQVSNFPTAQGIATNDTGRPRGEFLKLRHYVRQIRGHLLDKEA